jgi:3-hydroxymyristoyl/3-hydroxydecanoyl-(acyl carrier protein) dehydratase
MTKVSKAAEMLIEFFEFKVSTAGRVVYEGETYFGFFTRDALSKQKGMSPPEGIEFDTARNRTRGRALRLKAFSPLSPDDPETVPGPSLSMPAKALCMLDEIETYIPDGGPSGLGFARGKKKIDPEEWFFKAHFYQDPVCPGSLGIESFIQLLKFIAIDRWERLSNTHRFSAAVGSESKWIYRGQIVPGNKEIEVDAVVTRVAEMPDPMLMANGWVKVDGLTIYALENFGLKLIKV